MKWEKILKVQVLGTKQKVKQGIKPLPKEEEGDCRERLLDLMEKVQLKRDLLGITGHAQGVLEVSDIFSYGIPTEEECCEILKFIEDYFNNTQIQGAAFTKKTSEGNEMAMYMRYEKSLLTIEFTFRLTAHAGFPLVVIRTTDIGEISMTLVERKEEMNWTKF